MRNPDHRRRARLRLRRPQHPVHPRIGARQLRRRDACQRLGRADLHALSRVAAEALAAHDAVLLLHVPVPIPARHCAGLRRRAPPLAARRHYGAGGGVAGVLRRLAAGLSALAAGFRRGEFCAGPADGRPAAPPRRRHLRCRAQSRGAVLLQIHQLHLRCRQHTDRRAFAVLQHRAAARHLLLHLPADRLSGGCDARRQSRARHRQLHIIRVVLPASDRRPAGASRRDDPAVQALSRLLRDYLYIPLGGNRLGEQGRYINLMVTMLLGGLWHGAGWNFLIWGGLHGVYLSLNHLWLGWRGGKASASATGLAAKALSWVITFFAVVIAWVFFRARTMAGAWQMLGGLFGFEAGSSAYASSGILRLMDLPVLVGEERLLLIGGGAVALALAIALCLPNVPPLFGYREYRRAPEKPALLRWRPKGSWALVLAPPFAISLFGMWQRLEFLYFQF